MSADITKYLFQLQLLLLQHFQNDFVGDETACAVCGHVYMHTWPRATVCRQRA